MVEKKLGKLIERLHKKTLAGEIDWDATADPRRFQTALPDYTIQLTSDPSESASQAFELSVFDEEDRQIESVRPIDLQGVLTSPTGAMRDLYEAARRQALNVDEALDHLLEELSE